MKLLDKKDLNISHRNKKKYDALMKAVEVLNLQLIRIVFKMQPTSSAGVASIVSENLGLCSLLDVLDQNSHNGETALLTAVLKRDIYLIQLLLVNGVFDFEDKQGKDHNIVSEFLNSILVSGKEVCDEDLNVIKILIKAGAQLNSANNTREECPLATAVTLGSADLIKLLCLNGAEVKQCSYYFNYKAPLALAAEYGRGDIINLLIELGAKVKYDLDSALQVAIEHDQLVCAKLLVEHGAMINPDAVLRFIVRLNKIDSFLFLKEHFQDCVSSNIRQIGTKLLDLAAELGHKDMIRLLVQEGVSVNGDIYTYTPLLSAIDSTVMEVLINLGADVNLTMKLNIADSVLNCILTETELKRGRTKDSFTERVKLLIKYGANVNFKDHNGKTPLMKASKISDTQDVLRALLQAGADVNQQNNKGESALHYAAVCESTDNAKILLEFKSDINLQNNMGMTPLFYSLPRGHKDMIDFLIENNADVNRMDNKGNTPLLYACSPFFNDPIEAIKILVSAKAFVNHQNHEGYTALMLAAKQTNFEIINTLHDSGANVNIVNELKNETALSILISLDFDQRFNKATLYLIEKGADDSSLDPCLIHEIIISKEFSCLQILISLGLGPKEVKAVDLGFYEFKSIVQTASPLVVSLICGSARLARYLNEIWFLTQADVFSLAKNKQFRTCMAVKNYSECLEFLDEYSSQPMSLQKLSFVVVSSAVGAGPGRKERVIKLPIPTALHELLLFKRAAATEIIKKESVKEISMHDRQEMIRLLYKSINKRAYEYSSYGDDYFLYGIYDSDFVYDSDDDSKGSDYY
ncbi:ankyrin repeat and KH domain-containing protein 1-like [Physella acuta]|uniref:ankyrin repeat and KH domain-containing protein 1-like n=1 Tax=Physella acuta TaxID=109671 RepID=UPI0027DE8E3E|nr:ankyrin repeat and KH domain-containing protein 1-like [Physella acuta]